MLFSRGGADVEVETESPAIIISSAEMKLRRQMEKQQKKFQKIQEKQNVREYEENFHTKNYTNIRSKVFQLRTKKVDTGNEKITINDKVLINRRVLNDYIHIVNKRQDVVDSMEDNFWSMVQLYDGTLHYFNKYYGKKLEDQMTKLNHMLKPEHRYLLKNIDRNEARIKRRLIEYEQVKKSSDPSLKKALQECKNIEEIVSKNHQQQRLKAADRRNKNKSEGHIEKLSKKKGYIVNEIDVEQRRQNQIIMNEVQKFGSDRIKRKLFEQDMKVILENQEIQDKIHHIQMSLEKMQGQGGQGHANKSSNFAYSTIGNSQTDDINDTNQKTQITQRTNNNNPPSLQHIKMITPRSPNFDPIQVNNTANNNNNHHHHHHPYFASALNSPFNSNNNENMAFDESVITRRHSHNNLNPFMHYSAIPKSIASPIMKQIKDQALHSKSVDRLSLNSIDENEQLESEDRVPNKKDVRSSIFNLKQQNQKKQSPKITKHTNNNNMTLREQNFLNYQIEQENQAKQKLKFNNEIDFQSPSSLPTSTSQAKHQFIFDNISQMSQSKKPSNLSANDSSGFNSTNGDRKFKSVVSFVLPSHDQLAAITPPRDSTNEKQVKSTTSNSFYSTQESKSKFNQLNAIVGPFSAKEGGPLPRISKMNQTANTLEIRKASLDLVMGRSVGENQKKVAIGQISIQIPDDQQLRNSKSNLLTPLKPALKKSHQNLPTNENLGSHTNLNTQDTLISNIQHKTPQNSINNSQTQPLSQDAPQSGSDQNIQTSITNIQTQESPTKMGQAKFSRSSVIKRLTTLVSNDSVGMGQQKNKYSKSMLLSDSVQPSNTLEEGMTQSTGKLDEKKSLDQENLTQQEQLTSSSDSDEDDEDSHNNKKDGGSSRSRDNNKSDQRDRKKKKSMVEILGKKSAQSLDKINQPPQEQVHEKPLIRNKIYNENDLFKYKKINQYAIQEIYEKRILNMHKDETPMLSVKELQEIEEKSKKTLTRMNTSSHHSKHFSWNNLEEKKADFLSLEKQRSLYFNPEQDEVFEKKISQLHGSDVFDRYRTIQKNCNTQIEQSKTFQKDIKDGEQELKFKHKILRQQYAENLGPKEYKSKYVQQILDQTKRQLNFKLKKKSRSQVSSPEKILQNLLKQDKQKWGKTIKSKSAMKDEDEILGQKQEKKYNMFSSQTTLSESDKKQMRNQSKQQLEKILDKFKNSSHSQSMQEQLQSLMNLDSKRKALFGATQKMYIPGSSVKNKQKNKYLNGVLSNSNIDMSTYQDLKQQLNNSHFTPKINSNIQINVSKPALSDHSDNETEQQQQQIQQSDD